jgi:integrase/recombinase XerD
MYGVRVQKTRSRDTISAMRGNHLTPYRRHLDACPDRAKGANYTLCSCPIWCYGNLNGEPYRRSVRTADAATANRRIDALLRNPEAPETILPAASPLTVASAVKSYLSDCAARKLEDSTIRSYTDVLNAFVKHAGGAVSQLDADAVRSFRASRNVTARTQRKEIEHLRAFCAFCVSNKWLSANPAKAVKPPKIDDLATLPYTEEEIAQLFAACDRLRSDQKRARALVLALLYTGLRIGDLARLRRAQIEKSGHVVIRQTQKTSAPIKLPLHADARKALESLPAPNGNPTYFFWTGRGKLSSIVGSLRRTVAAIGKLAGVHAHPHRFRDTFAVKLLTEGADIRTVQKLLGHDSVRTTEKHYAHFVAAHQKLLDEAAARLDFRPAPARPLLVDTRKNRRRNAK